MSPVRRTRLPFSTVLLVMALGMAGDTAAQGYPNRPVMMLVGFAPGGAGDITARTLAKTFGEYLGQNVVVENRPGAGGSIAATSVAKANADGYTLLLGNVGALTVAPHLNAK